jgi:hypothetical protein
MTKKIREELVEHGIDHGIDISAFSENERGTGTAAASVEVLLTALIIHIL